MTQTAGERVHARWAWAVACVLVSSCARAPEEPAPPVVLEAARAAVVIDGELDEPEWTAHPPTRRFVDATSGGPSTPYTEARVLCDPAGLAIVIYAADEDLRGSDRVGAVLHAPGLETRIVEVDPMGEVRWHAPVGDRMDVPEGVSARVDLDGTYEHDDIEDEEWIVELRVPWAALGMSGPGDVRANFFRRDQPRDAPMRTLAWTPWGERPTAAPETLGLVRCGDGP
jgi:hypothetical protein